jgi:hypothetical protein
VHHPQGGPIGRHPMGATAQVFVVRPDGSDLRQLTTAHGCHIAPTPYRDQLFFGHATCRGRGRGFEKLSTRGGAKEVELRDSTGGWSESAVSPEGRLLVVEMVDITVRFFETSAKSFKPQLLFEFSRFGDEVRPAWLSGSKAFLFQVGEFVYRAEGKKQPVRVASLRGSPK